MGFIRNISKQELIAQFGPTWGLPLFQQEKPAAHHSKIPDWIWNGNSVKAEVYNKMKDKFAEDSLIYLNAIISLGGSATDHEVMDFLNDSKKWTVAIISARRNYFIDHPYYIITSYPDKVQKLPGGRKRTIWFVDFSKLFTLLM